MTSGGDEELEAAIAVGDTLIAAHRFVQVRPIACIHDVKLATVLQDACAKGYAAVIVDIPNLVNSPFLSRIDAPVRAMGTVALYACAAEKAQ